MLLGLLLSLPLQLIITERLKSQPPSVLLLQEISITIEQFISSDCADDELIRMLSSLTNQCNDCKFYQRYNRSCKICMGKNIR